MRKTEPNNFGHITDSIKKGIRENRIAEEKNRLMMPDREVRTCKPQIVTQ